MAREVRKVTESWQHPRAGDGKMLPMHEPQMAHLMKGDRGHFQMYETTTEGTPLSPVFASKSDLAQWLADHGVSLFGERLATKEQWLTIIDDPTASIPAFVKATITSRRIH